MGNAIAFKYESVIDSALVKPVPLDEETTAVIAASGQKMAQRIVEEGTVLLKNENETLPLSTEETPRVNVFGWHSIDWLYGTGGGKVSSGGVLPENNDISENIDLYKALNEYGIRYNEDLYNMYYNYKRPYLLAESWGKANITDAMPLVEPLITDKNYYTDKLLSDAKAYSDTALVVISRLMGEGGDPSRSSQPKDGPDGRTTAEGRHFLEISTEEEALLSYVGANFEKVIVLINTCNQFELGFLDTIEGLDACMYVGYTGTRAAVSLPKLLYGEVNPSGHLSDTFAYDIMTNPSAIWTTTKYKDSTWADHLDKVAGIYVGYKWYETADAEGLWSEQNGYPGGYDSVVQFPFGYGLSYTDFEWTVDEIKIDGTPVTEGAQLAANSKVEFTVTVTNTGDRAGRDVVEVYCTPPYTDGGIEKSFVNLVGYGKTNEIEPKGSETITVTVDMYDVASYDCYDKNGNGFKGWELDDGDYLFKLMTDSHNIKTVTYGGGSREGSFTFNIGEKLKIEKDPVTGEVVKNLFTGEDAVDTVSIDGIEENFTPDIPWISRAAMPTPAVVAEQHASSRREKNPSLAGFDNLNMDRWREWDAQTGLDAFGNQIDTSDVTWGSGGDLKLAENGIVTELGEKLGANYDDPRWDAVLDQVKFNEALGVMNQYYGSREIESVGKPWLTDLDGPTQIRGYNPSYPRGTGYPSMVIIACTWNSRLAYDYGKSFGEDMNAVNVRGLWGFANDQHVNPFFGRNNESPSEDPLLAGVTMSNAVRGLNTRGRYCFIKHFATYESGVANTWMSEQTLRETVLKAHRRAFVEGGALGVMTSYQSVGAEVSTNSEALLTGVLRGEWGFNGAITSDASGGNHHFMEGLVRCGGNFGMNIELGSMGIPYSETETTNRMQHRMRESVHQILYMWLRSDYNEKAYAANPDEGDTYRSSIGIDGWRWWVPFIYTLDAVMACVLAFWLFCVLSGFIVGLRNRRAAAPVDPGTGGAPNNPGGDSPSDDKTFTAFTAVGDPSAADGGGMNDAASTERETPSAEDGAPSDEAAEETAEDRESPFAEAYAVLPPDAKDRAEAVKAYAAKVPEASIRETKNGIAFRSGSRTFMKMKIRRGVPVVFFDLESEEVRSYRKESGAKIPRSNVAIRLKDDESVATACRMTDMSLARFEREHEAALARRRDQRRARRDANDGEGGSDNE